MMQSPETNSRYWVYRLEFDDVSRAEIALALLSETGFESFEQSPDGIRLDAYWDTHFGPAPEEEALRGWLAGFEPREIKLETLENINWNQEWESRFEPVEVDSFCRIRAEFHPSKSGFEHELLIQPKMSFGTGHHPTTHQMIALMRRLDFKEKSVLDMGCGTGVLAILAEKLGAQSALAIDNDPWCEENARENARRNQSTRLEVKLGGSEQIGTGPFEIVLANINRNILLEQIPAYSACASPRADLLLSGFYPEDEAALLECAAPYGWSLVEKSLRNGWSALHLKR